MSAESDKAESEMVLATAKRLGEHFDAVEILVSRYDAEDGTRIVAKGCGNWHARLGLVHEWKLNMDEQIREEGREIARKDDDDS